MNRCTQADLERIGRIEQAFDQVSAAFACGALDEETRENIRLLEDYVLSGRWLRDYALDEQGYWPRGLKRGVLSQDALDDLLRKIDGEEK